MRQFMMTVIALSVFGAIVVTHKLRTRPPILGPFTSSEEADGFANCTPSRAKRNSYDLCLKRRTIWGSSMVRLV
jgi:hypothetical protein